MKKTIAYIATAIILGLSVVIMPRTLDLQHLPTGPETNDARYQVSPQTYGGETPEKGIAGLASHPANLSLLALILLSGIIVAAAVSAIFRRRITTQPRILPL